MASEPDSTQFPHPLSIHAPDGSEVTVSPHGAHVLSWRTDDGQDQLYLSKRAEYRAGVAIRGGIPVIFPQFAAEGALPKHGFARTARWRMTRHDADRLQFELCDRDGSHSTWPFRYLAELTASVKARQLHVELAVTNFDAQPFTFTAALHTYLRVDSVEASTIHGLGGLRYRDSAHAGIQLIEHDPALRIAGEVDRIYFDAPPALELIEKRRQVKVVSNGFPDAVVWNPGAEKAVQLSDLDAEGWRHFLCLEAAAIGHPIQLQPTQRWVGSQTLITL